MATPSKAKANPTTVARESTSVLQDTRDEQSRNAPLSPEEIETLEEEGPSYYPKSLPYFLEENLSFFEGDVVKRLIRYGRTRNPKEDKAKIIRSLSLIKEFRRSKKEKHKLQLAYQAFLYDHLYDTALGLVTEGKHVGGEFYREVHIHNEFYVSEFISALCQKNSAAALIAFKEDLKLL